jgi:hypothetical protein
MSLITVISTSSALPGTPTSTQTFSSSTSFRRRLTTHRAIVHPFFGGVTSSWASRSVSASVVRNRSRRSGRCWRAYGQRRRPRSAQGSFPNTGPRQPVCAWWLEDSLSLFAQKEAVPALVPAGQSGPSRSTAETFEAPRPPIGEHGNLGRDVPSHPRSARPAGGAHQPRPLPACSRRREDDAEEGPLPLERTDGSMLVKLTCDVPRRRLKPRSVQVGSGAAHRGRSSGGDHGKRREKRDESDDRI